MNELMLALEAMIRRIVKEEMAANPVNLAVSSDEFKTAIKDAIIDQPWFDNAIKAEIAMQPTPAPSTAPGGFLLQIDTRDKFRTMIREVVFNYFEDDLNDHICDRVRDMDFDCSVSVS